MDIGKVNLGIKKDMLKQEEEKKSFLLSLESAKYSELLLFEVDAIRKLKELNEELREDAKNFKKLQAVQLAKFKVSAINYKIQAEKRNEDYNSYGVIGK